MFAYINDCLDKSTQVIDLILGVIYKYHMYNSREKILKNMIMMNCI